MTSVEIITCSTADELLQTLRPTNPFWGLHPSKPRTWIFRGHADAEWPLIPSVWRTHNLLFFALKERLILDFNKPVHDWVNHRLPFHYPLDHDEDRDKFERGLRVRKLAVTIAAEMALIKDFVRLADSLGKSIPEPDWLNLDILKETLAILSNLLEHDVGWLRHGHSICLAQHHGIPTRLLDWTTNSSVAAFFAAEGIEIPPLRSRLQKYLPQRGFLGPAEEGEPAVWGPKEVPAGSLAIWALDTSHLIDTSISELRAPRALTPFLHAQSGLFTVDVAAEAFYLDHNRWPMLAERLPSGALRKLVLPRSEGMPLLHALFLQEISRAHLMPTLDNIAATLQKKWEWEYPEY